MPRWWRRQRALARMGVHERWRAAMISDPTMSGEIYCHCDRCERDMAIYVACGGPFGVRQTRDQALTTALSVLRWRVDHPLPPVKRQGD